MDPAFQKAQRDWLDQHETAQQPQSGIELVSLTLETETGIPAEQFMQVEPRERPALQLEEGADLFSVWLSRNPRLQRQLLYLELDVLEEQEQELQRKPAVALDAGAQLNIRDLGITPITDVSWSLLLSVIAPELAQADFSVDLDGHGLTQRSSLNWTDQPRRDSPALLPSDGRRLPGWSVLHLQELLHRLVSAERGVARFTAEAAGSLELLAAHAKPEAVTSGDLPLLSLAVNSVYSLLQAELKFDQTLLELAAECQLPVVYQDAEDPLTAALLTRLAPPVASEVHSTR